MFTRSQMSQTVKWAVKNASKLHFDHAVQRNEVWNEDQKSLLIHSLMVGYPIPPFYSIDNNDGQLWFIDGKQRLTTLIKFFQGEFELTKNTPPVELNGKEVEVVGMNFLELPEELRDNVKDYMLNIYKFQNITEDEIEEMFLRLSNGTSLTKIERTRIFAGTKFMSFVKEVAIQKFFKELIAISENARNRFIDEEIILQTISLICSGENFTSFSSKHILEFVQDNKNGIAEEYQDDILNATMYLEEAIPVKHKKLKKVHIPILFAVAIEAQKQGVPARAYGEWLFDFLENYPVGGSYGCHCTTKTADKEHVLGRLKAMREHFRNNINVSQAAK